MTLVDDNAPVPTYRDQAVVLRSHNLGEADRILTLLTREHGQVRAVAKGIRKTTSRFGARLDLLNLVDVQCHIGHSLDTVTQVETVAAFGAVAVSDYSIWTLGQAMAETAEKLTDRESATQQFLLLVSGLRALVAGENDPGLVCDAYMLRSLAVAGWGSSFDNCARCDSPGPHRWFSTSAGGALCRDCRVPGSVTPALETIALMGALLAGDWDHANSVEAKHRSEATGIINASLQWHLEREVRALKHVDRNLRGSVRAI